MPKCGLKIYASLQKGKITTKQIERKFLCCICISLVHIAQRRGKALPAEAQKPDMPVVLGKVCLAFPVIQLWAHTQNYQPIGSVFH